MIGLKAFKSAIYAAKTGPMDDVARVLASEGHAALSGGAAATHANAPLTKFVAHVDDARGLFDEGIKSLQGWASPADTALAKSQFSAMGDALNAARETHIHHTAMGHANSAQNAANSIIKRLDDFGAAMPQATDPLHMDLWGARFGLDSAFDAAGAAKILGNWK